MRDYALVGDSRTCALSSSDGSIDWWAVPTMASPPVFGRLLDAARGGHFVVRPDGDYEVARGYADDNATPETTFRTPTGVVRLADALLEFDGETPQAGLVRRVVGVEGTVTLVWEIVVGDRFGSSDVRAKAHSGDGVGWIVLDDLCLGVVSHNGGSSQVVDGGFSGSFTCAEGDEAMLAVVSASQQVPRVDVVEHRAGEGIRSWANWTKGIRYDGPWADAVRRSAIVLKQLTYKPTGALQAAATTSLPEHIGGKLNYDYRFTWVRDTAFAIDAMATIGMDTEVRTVMRCLLDEVRKTAPDIKVLYSIEGDTVAGHIDEVPEWDGYRGSKPVRSGNNAAKQRQLGSTGDLLDAVWRYVRHGNKLESGDARMIASIADETCGIWTENDSGIWELGEHRQYTISKIGCWTALDRAARLADDGHIPDEHVDRWRESAAQIRSYVEENCWSSEKSSYTMFAGGDKLDCGVLLAGRTLYCGPDDERLSSTIDAIRRELSAGGPLVYRYSGVQGDEGAFIACSFWMVEALAHLGRLDEAREVMEGMIVLANDLGLYSEQIDPNTHELLGNIPQALSHLALVGAAAGIANASEGKGPR